MPASVVERVGPRLGHLGQRGVVEDDVGRQVVRARDLGAPGLERGEALERRRRRAAAAAACRARAADAAPRLRVPRRAPALRLASRSSSVHLAAQHRARRSSVSASVLYSPSVAQVAERDQLAQHARATAPRDTSAPMPKVLSALVAVLRRPSRSPCRAARRSGGRRRSCWPRVLLEAVDAGERLARGLGRVPGRGRRAGSCRSCRSGAGCSPRRSRRAGARAGSRAPRPAPAARRACRAGRA